MSLDSSLKAASALTKHRNVLTRDERIAKLAETGKFDMEEDDPLGLVKVANRKVVTGSKSKKDKAAEEGAEGEAATTTEAPPAGGEAPAATS